MYDCKRSYLESDHQKNFLCIADVDYISVGAGLLRPSWDKLEPALVLDFGSMFTPKGKVHKKNQKRNQQALFLCMYV